MRNWKFENFKKGPLSTLIGLMLMGAAVYVYLKVPNSEVFALALLAAGGIAFGLKDPKLPGGTAGVAMLTIVLVVFMSSCVTYKKCFDTFGSMGKDTIKVPVEVVVHDTIPVVVPGDSLVGSVSDSALNHLRNHLEDTLKQVSESGKLTIKFWYDKYRRALAYNATLKPDTARIPRVDTVRAVADCPPAVVFDPLGKLPWYNPAKLWDGYKNFSGWLLAAAVLTAFIYSKFRRA